MVLRGKASCICILTLLILTAGCTESARTGTHTTDTVASTSATAATSVQNQTLENGFVADSEATELAIEAERERVEEILRNATTIEGNASVGIYGEISARILDRKSGEVTISVVMSYSYGYDCDDRGVIDGATTSARYVVTRDTVRLERVYEDVVLVCATPTD